MCCVSEEKSSGAILRPPVGFLSVFMKEHSIGKVFGPVVATLGSASPDLQVIMYTLVLDGDSRTRVGV